MKRLLIFVSLIAGFFLIMSPGVLADELPSVTSPSVFSTSGDAQPSADSNSPQAIRAAKHRLHLPSKTPTPTEGYRWPNRKITIYMDTQDNQLRTAFRAAVRAWNKTGAVKMKWTNNRERADIIVRDGSLSSGSAAPSVGYTTAQLGSTSTQYNPDTHALVQARSTLDPNQLDYTSLSFRTEVAEHELGHALGLAHAPEYVHSVMIPRNVKSGITKNDRQTIRQLYNVER